MLGFQHYLLFPCVYYSFDGADENRIFSFYNPIGVFVYCIIPLLLIPITNIVDSFLIAFSVTFIIFQTLFLVYAKRTTIRKIEEYIEYKQKSGG